MIHYKNRIDCKRKDSGTNNAATRLATAIANYIGKNSSNYKNRAESEIYAFKQSKQMLRINLLFQKKHRQNKRKIFSKIFSVDFFKAKSELDHKKSKKQDEKKKY